MRLLSIFVWLAFQVVMARDLEISVIDVEGGKAVLMVSPSGKSMLVDAGWPAGRTRPSSTPRIVEALRAAGVKRIDVLVITHYDVDHLGNVPELMARVPIGHVYDHGDFVKRNEQWDEYARVRARLPHTVVKAGDGIPFGEVKVDVLTAAGQIQKRKGSANPLCATNPQKPELTSDFEDDQSIGLLITYGAFRMLDLADLEAHLSHELVCPDNGIGKVDVYNVNVHGQFKGIAPELVGAIRPSVLVQANGPKKGADAQTWPVLKEVGGDIWQVHQSLNSPENPPADFVANPDGPDEFKWIQVSVSKDGSYVVKNTRNGFQKQYPSASTEVCELLAKPREFDGRVVSVEATVIAAFEDSRLDTSGCREGRGDIWFEYGAGPKRQPVVWCCGDSTPKDRSRVSIDANFRQFERSLKTHPDGIRAVLRGRFDAVETIPCSDQTKACPKDGGFGHLGVAPYRFVLEAVQASR